MVRYAILGSGSSGNSFVFDDGNTSIMVDNGFSVREARSRAESAGFDLQRLQAVMLTHAHGDHDRGVAALARSYRIPLYLHASLDPTRYTKTKGPECRSFSIAEPFEISGFRVMGFPTNHDVTGSCGFSIHVSGVHFVIMTDTGSISESMAVLASQADVLFLEANYETDMLLQGPYPYHLKRRIHSEHGHLSNNDAIALVRALSESDKPDTIYLCHLSGTNNTVETVRSGLCRAGIERTREIIICEKGRGYAASFGSCEDDR